MRRLIITIVAGAVTVVLTGAVNATVYTPGIIVVEFADNVNLERNPGMKGSGHGSLDLLAEKYDVYDVEALYTMPKEPIEHPRGAWDWEDYLRAVEKARLKYLFAIRFRSKVDPVVVAEDYKRDVHVVNANAEGHGEAYAFPNDQYFDQQWYLYYEYNRDCDIHWPEAWDRFIGVPPHVFDGYPIAGVVDTGLYYSPGGYVHEDIRENIGVGFDVFGEDLPRDLSGHGTSVCGVVGADTDNYLGITGVAINYADIMPVRAFYDKPLEPMFTFLGIYTAVYWGADVVNMSWGYDYCPVEIKKGLEFAWDLDRVTIASSGNNPDPTGPFYSYPAVEEDPRMISIGGTLRIPVEGWERWEHSGYHCFTVDVVAPASPDIFSLWLDDGYRGDLEGTSYSSAMGTGIASACLVMLEGPYEGIDHDVRECIHHGGSEYIEGGYPDEKYGWGTEYYEEALDWAMVIRDGGGDGGSRALTGAAPALRLAQNAPNPATSSTTIRLELSSKDATRAELVIYDLSGRRVRTFDVPVRDGLAEVAWDLKTSAGARVAPGVYIYRVSAGGLAAAKKCVVH